MSRDFKIAISGKSGCGNTTVSRMLAQALDIQFINFTFRSLAAEHGIDLPKVLELAASDDYWDREVDRRQVMLARESVGCVLGSRLAIWMLPEADLKVFLTADAKTRAKRIIAREGESAESAITFTEERDRQDHNRYLKIYGIDNDKYEFADLIINTENLSPDEITGIIIAKIKEKSIGN